MPTEIVSKLKYEGSVNVTIVNAGRVTVACFILHAATPRGRVRITACTTDNCNRRVNNWLQLSHSSPRYAVVSCAEPRGRSGQKWVQGASHVSQLARIVSPEEYGGLDLKKYRGSWARDPSNGRNRLLNVKLWENEQRTVDPHPE